MDTTAGFLVSLFHGILEFSASMHGSLGTAKSASCCRETEKMEETEVKLSAF